MALKPSEALAQFAQELTARAQETIRGATGLDADVVMVVVTENSAEDGVTVASSTIAFDYPLARKAIIDALERAYQTVIQSPPDYIGKRDVR